MPYDSNGNFSLTPGYLAVAGQTIQPSQHNPPLEDISTGGLSLVLVRDGRAPMTGPLNMNGFKVLNVLAGSSATDAVNKAQLDLKADASGSTITNSTIVTPKGDFLRGYLWGLTLANNGADAVNDIDIAAGATSSDGAPASLMSLASILTKRLDAAWAVGTNQGGLDTGSIANTTYHIWLIQRSDTGVVDALFSASATAPTMPTNYDRKRRVGSIIREAGAIVTFSQEGDTFRRTGAVDRSSTSGAASGGLQLSVPAGIIVSPIMRIFLAVGATVNCAVNIGSAVDGVANVTVAQCVTGAGGSDVSIALPPAMFFTNTSRQIFFEQVNGAGTPTQSTLTTLGWVDTRGRLHS